MSTSKVKKNPGLSNNKPAESTANSRENELIAAKESIQNFLRGVSPKYDLRDPLFHFFDFAGDEAFWIYKNVCVALWKFLSVPENSTFLRNGISEAVYPDLLDLISRLSDFAQEVEDERFAAQILLYGLENYPRLAENLPSIEKHYRDLAMGLKKSK